MRDEGATGKERSVSDSLDDATQTVGPSPAATKTTMASDGDALAEREAPAAAFGRYKLEERIGAGGMGVVYRAYDPMLERPVALKIVRSQRGGEEGQRRLFREAQVLAQVRHPNVVAVHDVGALGEDVFVAMELVEGTPLSRWQKDRDTRDILSAYLQAGRGLAAAHKRGLVHRDVKPDNILVGEDGRVTVIDFGLAAVDDDSCVPERPPSVSAADDAVSTEGSAVADGSVEHSSHSSLRTPLTEFGKIMGTPRYMSPEQHVGGQRVDALSDQYSFAVALYEALAKTWPFVRGTTARDRMDEIRTAKLRGVFAPPARGISTHVRRTLQRALAVEPSERFPSMVALLEQLANDPARARRRRLAVAAVVTSVVLGAWSTLARYDDDGVALCKGAAEELSQTWNLERRDDVKNAFLASGVSYAADTFERVASALDAYGNDWTRMRTQACEATHVEGVQSEKVLDLRMGCLDRKRRSLQALVSLFADKPDREVVDKAVEASLALGGLAFCADIKALEQEVAPPESSEDRRILAELRGRLEDANQLYKLGKYREAEVIVQQLAAPVEALGFPPLQAEFAFHRALTLAALGKYPEAEPRFKEAIRLAIRWGMKVLAAEAGTEATHLVGFTLQRHAEGLIYALHTQGLVLGRGDESEARMLNNVALVYGSQGKYEEAAELHERALAIREKALGPDHPDVAKSLGNLAIIYRDLGKYGKAEELNKRGLRIKEKALGAEHPSVAFALNNLAYVYYAQEKYAEAEGLYRRSLTIREKALGPDHPQVAYSVNNLGSVYGAQGKYAEAEKLLQRGLAIREKSLGPDHPDVAYPLVELAETYEKQRRFSEAIPLLERARKIRDKAKVAPRERADATFALARGLWAVGKERTRARALAQEALALYQAAGPGVDKQRRDLERWIAAHP